jgi:predicted PhzF superfamily epimerase YddE/YHI9
VSSIIKYIFYPIKMSTKVPIWTVDSFTSSPISGNPAGVCLLDKDLTINDEIKQKIAAEMRLVL